MARHYLLPLALLTSLPLFAQPGTSCSEPLTAQPDVVIDAVLQDNWYSYTAPSDGLALITTCGLADCDTRIHVYDHCDGLTFDEGALNTIAYNDNTCEQASSVSLPMTAGQTYWIRIVSVDGDCVLGGPDWRLHFDAPCAPGEIHVRVDIVPDNWPEETSWILRSNEGASIGTGESEGASFCVPEDACMTFTIYDQFGDGITGGGGYWIYKNGVLEGSGIGDFGDSARVQLSCPPGEVCSSALPITEGMHEAPAADTWYLFVPEENGSYSISTCGMNTCDTRIWVYDHCASLIWNETNAGTITFNDDNPTCGQQALVNVALAAERMYWIRIGDTGDACGDSAIPWALVYNGPISGCMDITACNYNPLAAVDDGSCLAQGDPACPHAPDLLVRQDILETTLVQSIENINDNYYCLLNEDCVSGFGQRELVNFTTHIDNIGDMDFFLGIPNTETGQFIYDPCHGHFHYIGYAEYLLFDVNGQQMAQGFKNGFCVFDLTCPPGIPGQFSCENMGITAGCGDYYFNGLDCQWIDITGVPEGHYKLVIRVNWDNSPDALGHYESNFSNNWAQVCIFIDRNPNLIVSIEDDCAPYTDCAGVVFGSAQFDCEEVCAGTRLMGDLDVDDDQDFVDAGAYIGGILDGFLTAQPCNDVNNDGMLTVSDVAIVANCHQMDLTEGPGEHDRCQFPMLKVVNIFDTVTFTIGDYDPVAGFLDVHVRNPERDLIGYEFTVSGLHVTGVESLQDPVEYPATLGFDPGGHIIGLSEVDSTITHHTTYAPLVRIHFDAAEGMICIDAIIDVVNREYHNGLGYIHQGCLVSTGLSAWSAQRVHVLPNPAHGSATVLHPSLPGGALRLELSDAQGRTVRRFVTFGGQRTTIDLEGLSPGVYMYAVSGVLQAKGRLIVE